MGNMHTLMTGRWEGQWNVEIEMHQFANSIARVALQRFEPVCLRLEGGSADLHHVTGKTCTQKQKGPL